MKEETFKKLLQLVMRYNFDRHGAHLMHDAGDFLGAHKDPS
jgi:hypothetical protein